MTTKLIAFTYNKKRRFTLSGWAFPPIDFEPHMIPLDHLSAPKLDQGNQEELKLDAANAKPINMSEVDAKIAAAEARTDTKFAEVMGELRLINQRLAHVETSMSGVRLNIWLAAVAAVTLVVAIFGWGSSMFGVGMDAQSIANQSAKSVLEQVQPSLNNFDRQLEDVLKAMQAFEKQPAPDPKP